MDDNRRYYNLAEKIEREVRESDKPTEPIGISVRLLGKFIRDRHKEELPKEFVELVRITYQLFEAKDIGIVVCIKENGKEMQFIFTTYGVCVASCLRFKDENGVYKRDWDYPWFPRQEYSRFYGITRWD